MSIVKSLSNVWASLSSAAKFTARYADEAVSIATALRAILPALPIGASDKAKVNATIDQLENAANNITEFLNGENDFSPQVVVKESDVLKAVEAYFAANPDAIGIIAKNDAPATKPAAKGQA